MVGPKRLNSGDTPDTALSKEKIVLPARGSGREHHGPDIETKKAEAEDILRRYRDALHILAK